MTVFKSNIFIDSERGASVMEVLLAMAIIVMVSPFVYNQIAQTNHTLHDIAIAKKIIDTRDGTLNFVRMNQDQWPDNAQIKLSDDELDTISTDATTGFIDKYTVRGATITDVYLSFDLKDTELRTKQIAQHIGDDAAIVADDRIAYVNTWAVQAPDFVPGNLIYRISRDVSGEDTSKYLHRGTSGEDDLNIMQRDLNMGAHHVYNVANMNAESVKIKNINSTFVDATNIVANNVYFSAGANIDNANINLGNVRVSSDMSGFKNITSDNINGAGYTTAGRIIADRATITNKINVGNNMTLKSDSVRTISGFTGITVNSVYTPYIVAEEMMFYDNFGLTVSGELLMSTTSPLKIGSWVFPSTKPPQFTSFSVSRATRPEPPKNSDFDALMRDGWQETNTITGIIQ
ncbi:MAG: hypothetical protein R8M37_03660 [Alphaproteobacteria bacterium]|nr:hypothetical protein [Alphaproteobacteria bacterium]